MSYCDGTCKYLNTRKHKCELTGEKLTYMKQSCGIEYSVHEHRGFCEKDKEDDETETKAMKVLDMIQEAYEEYKITRTFLTGFTGHRAIVESNDIHVNGFKELVKSFKKNMVFQMPEDSEV